MNEKLAPVERSAADGIESLTRYTDDRIASEPWGNRQFFLTTDVERLLAARTVGQGADDARDAVLITARDAINVLLHQFTATPSTFRDSNARCQGHEAIKAIDAAIAAATQTEGK